VERESNISLVVHSLLPRVRARVRVKG
jgi:hypothetical protein